MALCQQLVAYLTKKQIPNITDIDRSSWIAMKQIWSTGRLPIDKEVINHIKQMATENNWGASRIYSELLMPGYDSVKQITVSRYLRKFRSRYPDHKKRQSWITFLKNNQEVISLMDLFIVPTVNFRLEN